jgi:Cdc6-like AAA superfamily ATPase
LQWLSPVDFALDQHDIISQRHEGTGQWFLDSPTFQNWLYGDRNWNILFCPGIPGAGKTIMAAVAIDHISRLREKKGLATGLAYVFCKYKAQADQSVSSLFAALLKQLVRSRPQTTAATTLIQWHIGGNCQPLLDELAEKMQSVCADYSTVYIVVDALDECDDKGGDRSRLVDKLCDLQVRGNSDVRLLFTSRLIPDIEQRFQGAHQLTIHADNDDVRQFVAAQMPRLSNCIKRDEGLKALAQNAIVESVDGM